MSSKLLINILLTKLMKIVIFLSILQQFINVDDKKKELIIFITEMFSLKLRDFLIENFPAYDFSDIKGDVLQVVGYLKPKIPKFIPEEGHYI